MFAQDDGPFSLLGTRDLRGSRRVSSQLGIKRGLTSALAWAPNWGQEDLARRSCQMNSSASESGIQKQCTAQRNINRIEASYRSSTIVCAGATAGEDDDRDPESEGSNQSEIGTG